MKKIILMAACLLATSSAARAGACETNFAMTGVPMLTAISFKTWASMPKVKPDVALTRLAQAVAAEGFSGIQVNKQLGSVDAHQETTGSGRIQTLRIVARPSSTGTRVDAVFNIQQGQVTSEGVVKTGLCNIIRTAGGI